MRLSARARYAVRLMLEVHRNGGNKEPVQLSEVSRLTGISRRFLEQVALGLRTNSLLRSFCGRRGGYVLARPADQITVGDVIQAASGQIVLCNCVDDPGVCSRSDVCVCRLMWKLIQERLEAALAEYTIADLADEPTMSTLREAISDIEPDGDTSGRALGCSGEAGSGAPGCAQRNFIADIQGDSEE